jgi:hypothetical protein
LYADTAPPPIVLGQEGLGIQSTVSNNQLASVSAPTRFTSWTEFSIYWRGFVISTPHFGWFAGVEYATTVTSPYAVAALKLNDDQVHLETIWNTNATFASVACPTALITGAKLGFGGTYRVSGSAGSVFLYIDGVQVATATFGSLAPLWVDGVVLLNGWPAIPDRHPNSICYICCMWNRVLSAEEMAFLDRDPYGFLVPAEYEMPLFVPATLRQKHFRFRTDTAAADATPTWGALEDTN